MNVLNSSGPNIDPGGNSSKNLIIVVKSHFSSLFYTAQVIKKKS